MSAITSILNSIITDQPNSISAVVASDALDEDNPKAFLEGLIKHGCISGWVNHLIFYTDTERFFDDHYDEIEEIRIEWLEQTGQPVDLGNHLKNSLAWFAYEYRAHEILEMLDNS